METELLTKYIAAWSWQIIAIIFLTASFIFFSLPRTLKTNALYIAFFLVFIGCEYMALRRKREVYEDG